MNSRLSDTRRGLFVGTAAERTTLGEEAFHRMMTIERRRTSRSRKSFLLMLLDMDHTTEVRANRVSLRKIISTLSSMLRETDITGWYKQDSIVGVMFTEITLDEGSIPATMMDRVSQTLKNNLSPQQFHQLGISFHLLPEKREEEIVAQEAFPVVLPSISASETSY